MKKKIVTAYSKGLSKRIPFGNIFLRFRDIDVDVAETGNNYVYPKSQKPILPDFKNVTSQTRVFTLCPSQNTKFLQKRLYIYYYFSL